MYIGFSTRLKKMSGFRLGFGKRMTGKTTILIAFFVGMFYLLYWAMLGTMWCFYGICWLFIYKPALLIINAIKKHKAEKASV